MVSAELGLSGIWLICGLFQANRLVLNTIRLALPGSILRRTTPLQDTQALDPELEGRLMQVRVAGSS